MVCPVCDNKLIQLAGPGSKTMICCVRHECPMMLVFSSKTVRTRELTEFWRSLGL